MRSHCCSANQQRAYCHESYCHGVRAHLSSRMCRTFYKILWKKSRKKHREVSLKDARLHEVPCVSIDAGNVFDCNFFVDDFSAADRAHVPLPGAELPEKPAIARGRNRHTIYKPFHIAGARRCEFDHLL
jgi:hypothetical protein